MSHATISFNPASLQSVEQVKAFKRYQEVVKETGDVAASLKAVDDRADIDLDPAPGSVAVDHYALKGIPYSGLAKFDASGSLSRLSLEGERSGPVPPDFTEYVQRKYEFESTAEGQTYQIASVSQSGDWGGTLLEETKSDEKFQVNAGTGTITYDVDRSYYRDSD